VERRRQVIGSPMLRDEAVCGSPEMVVDRLAELERDGADTVYIHFYDTDDLDHVRLLGAEVLPKVQAGASGHGR
jgi:alkanesulfonate monooxygenase SsuD/methylene tetrahydromethanopterin reductase-like flavin-dependent oxidoreductase (luciferase family)